MIRSTTAPIARPARVLIQNPMLPPYRVELFKALAASPRLDVTFSYGLAKEGSALKDVRDVPGIEVLSVRNNYLFGGSVTLQRGLLKHLGAHRWDAMVASLDPRLAYNLLAFVKARWQGTRFIWWGHGIRPRGRFANIYRRLAMMADAVILYSEEGRKKLEEKGVPSDRLFVAWNSIDTATIDRLRSSDWSGRNRVLTIGRLSPEKKVDLLVEAFAKCLPSLSEDVRLSIVGEGNEKEVLVAKARDLGIGSRVDWHGAIYRHEELAPIFNASCICVGSGCVGLSAIHALAFGVPMLFADNEPHGPEVEALIPGTNSASFAAGDPVSLAGALEALLGDRRGLQALGTSGAEKVSREFSVDQMVKVFEEAIAYACRAR